MGRAQVGRRAIAVFVDLDWMDDAACKGRTDVDFFPERGDSLKPARDLCRTCPSREACVEYAVTNKIAYGVWGGTSDLERRKLRRARAKAAANG